MQRCNKKLHQLARIAYCPDYDLSPRSVWKLYVTTIRPIIEYGLNVYSACTETEFKKLESIQNRAMRIALRLKYMTPTEKMRKFLNCESIAQRLTRMRINLWCKLIRAPDHLLQHYTFHKWYEFMQEYHENHIFVASTLNPDNFNVASIKSAGKSPISRTYNTIRSLLPPDEPTQFNPTPQPYKALPSYLIPTPTRALQFFSDLEEYEIWSESNEFTADMETIQAWTDGSCMPNPGPGGFGVIFPSNPHHNQTIPIDHHTTINMAELRAIECALETTLSTVRFEPNCALAHTIAIFTDSKFCHTLLQPHGYPKFHYYWEVVNRINLLLQQLHQLDFNIQFVKVPAHSDIEFNEKVDALAKSAAEQAIENETNNSECWHPMRAPVMVHASQLLAEANRRRHQQFEQYVRNQWREYLDRLHNLSDHGPTPYKGEFLFSQGMVSFYDPYKILHNGKYFKEEINFLDRDTIQIINKLRSEQVNLHAWEHAYFPNQSNGLCDSCNCSENVSHYLLECQAFLQHQSELIQNLQKADPFFQNPAHLTTVNILFPYRWQIPPRWDDPAKKEILKSQRKTRFTILNAVCKYVRTTDRFNTEWGM